MLLVPLRLEYRVAEGGSVLPGRYPSRPSMGGKPAVEIIGRVALPKKLLHVRWVVDTPFAEMASKPADERERLLLQTYLGQVTAQGATWYEPISQELSSAWQDFTDEVGLSRAVHLCRDGGDAHESESECIGRLVGLPPRVVLFGLKDGELTALKEAATIPDDAQNVPRLTPQTLKQDGWLTDFEKAVAVGMGVTLEGEEAEQALNADWLVAVGIDQRDSREELQTYLNTAIAEGDFALVPQDTPTNNSGRVRAGFASREKDAVDGLLEHTFHEHNPGSVPNTDAAVLSDALGIDALVFRRARNAGRRDCILARLMATVLLPGLMAEADDLAILAGVELRDLRRFVRRWVTARGPLPALRFGDNPYGVLPILPVRQSQAPWPTGNAMNGCFELVLRLAEACDSEAVRGIDTVPRLRVQTGSRDDTLRRILQQLPVSSRVTIERYDTGGSSRFELGCPLAATEGTPGAVFWKDVKRQPLKTLLSDEYQTADTPLLHRLILLSIECLRSEMKNPPVSLDHCEAATRSSGEQGLELKEFIRAIDTLASCCDGELETLMMEVFDILHHRVDAWYTSLATSRLHRQREDGEKRLGIGWYGILEMPRSQPSTGSSDGFIVTPSLAQARTAALLRAAHLRHQEGDEPFRIDLSSRRARTAQMMLGRLRKGQTIGEILGYRAERYLHDRGLDALIHDLRQKYAQRPGENRNAATLALLDGERLLDAASVDMESVDEGHQSAFTGLLETLSDDMDALSDLITAEAVHQLAAGNTAAANAWLNVLSGDSVPAGDQFLRTKREGQGTTNRVCIVLPTLSCPGGHPRSIAEPVLADLAKRLLIGFEDCQLKFLLRNAASPSFIANPGWNSIRLHADLEMEPIDLLLGGEREIMSRARQHFLTRWRCEEAWRQELGSPPTRTPATILAQDMDWRVDLGFTAHGAPSARALLDRLDPLRRLLGRQRPLQPSDMNAAADPTVPWNETTALELRRYGLVELRKRAQTLVERLSDLAGPSGRLAPALDRVRDFASAYVTARKSPERPRQEVDGLHDTFLTAWFEADVLLSAAARFGLPDVMMPWGEEEILDDPEVHRQWAQLFLDGLVRKQAALVEAFTQTTLVDTIGLGESEAAEHALIAAIQGALDGEGLPIWTPFSTSSATEPMLETSSGSLEDILGGHIGLRGALRDLIGCGFEELGLSARRSVPAATADDVDDMDDRNDAGAATDAAGPRILYHGVYLLAGSTLPQNAICGCVVDEWSGFVPSRTHTAGIAVNYDSPQSEPPHVLLLGVAPRDDFPHWGYDEAAAVVAEAIRLMKLRAIGSRASAYDNLGLRIFNLVRGRQSDSRYGPRLPTGVEHNGRAQGAHGVFWNMQNKSPDSGRTAFNVVERGRPEE